MISSKNEIIKSHEKKRKRKHVLFSNKNKNKNKKLNDGRRVRDLLASERLCCEKSIKNAIEIELSLSTLFPYIAWKNTRFKSISIVRNSAGKKTFYQTQKNKLRC